MKILKYTLSFFLLFFIISCSLNDNEVDNQENELAFITKLKIEIEKLAASSICNEESECKYVALGSKPCGGPWSYLAYSTSLNEEFLLQKVAQLNTLENEYNIAYGIISDCSVPAPPTSVECVDGKCQAIYD